MIRVGIIGTGAMGEEHAQGYSRLSGVKCISCCDLDLERASKFGVKYGIKAVYSDPTDFFSTAGLDAVSIVTTDGSHAQLALQAIDCGLDVLCEKPLATTVGDADKMSAAARSAGVINAVNFSYRRSSAVSAAHKLLTDGALGHPRHFEGHYLQSWLVSSLWGDWKTDPKWLWRLSTQHGSGGALVDIGVHLLDLVTYVAGDVAWLECDLKTFDKGGKSTIGAYPLDANDSAVITLQLVNGALGTLHISRWATGHLNSIGLSIHGDRGAVRIDLDKSYDQLECCLDNDVEKAIWRTRDLEPLPSVLERFVTSVQKKKPAQPDFARGAYVQRLLEACFESHDKRVRVFPGKVLNGQ